MAYYVRKIVLAKWARLEKDADDILENYKADAIANDMRTTSNTLSLWRIEDLSEMSVEPIIAVNSLLGDYIAKIQLLFIPGQYLKSFSLEQEDGDTAVINFRSSHYNVKNLSVQKHLQFAKEVVLKIIKEENERLENADPVKLIRKYTDKEQLRLLKKWIELNEIDINKLKDGQKENIEKFIKESNNA